MKPRLSLSPFESIVTNTCSWSENGGDQKKLLAPTVTPPLNKIPRRLNISSSWKAPFCQVRKLMNERVNLPLKSVPSEAELHYVGTFGGGRSDRSLALTPQHLQEKALLMKEEKRRERFEGRSPRRGGAHL